MSIRYTVLGHYVTGDSFGSHETTSEIAVTWENKELAKKAMQELIEHYKIYDDYYCSGDTDEPSDKPWFSDKYPEFTIMLELDNGERQRTSIDWIGYFERLMELQVIVASDGDGDDCRIVL